MATQITPAEKLALIDSALDAGRTVYLCTYTRATKITPKTRAKFQAAGHPVLKVSHDPHGSSLWLASGRSYVCADYCAIRVEDSQLRFSLIPEIPPVASKPRAQIKDGQVIATIKDKFGEDRRVVQRGSRIRIAQNTATPILAMNREVSVLIGQKIRLARQAAGLSLEECAIRSGIVSGWPKNRMYEIETANRQQGVKIGTLYAIACALGVEVSEFMPSVADVMHLADVTMAEAQVITLSSRGRVTGTLKATAK